jgi:hypothetical protein
MGNRFRNPAIAVNKMPEKIIQFKQQSVTILMVLDEIPPIRVEMKSKPCPMPDRIHIACYTLKTNLPEQPAIIVQKSISGFLYKSSVASLTFPFYFWFWKKFLRHLLRSYTIDVLHVHDLPLVGVGIQLRAQFNLKLIADLHENWPAFLEISRHTQTFAGRLLSPNTLWRNTRKKFCKS